MHKLKEVSKIKHLILKKYFPAWAKILGSKNKILFYVDCFAGEGRYEDGVEGSPLIIAKEAYKLIKSNAPLSLSLIFVEKDKKRAEKLEENLKNNIVKNYRLNFMVFNQDITQIVSDIKKSIPENYPAFYFIDPYGHPLSIPIINEIMSQHKREILLILMWYSINMHLNNPKVEKTITNMFGDDNWKNQPFMNSKGIPREKQFIEYFISYLKSESDYILPFRIKFSPEDRIHGRHKRTKYYILHLSNHPKAALLMKEVMWPLGDEEGTFSYSAQNQQVLFSNTPSIEELIKNLSQNFKNQSIQFDKLRENTWYWPYIEKHYRNALKIMEKNGKVKILRINSKKSGIKGKDEIFFL